MQDPCIEFESKFSDDYRHERCVADYESAYERVQLLSPRAITFYGIRWADGAPSIYELSEEWTPTKEGRIRISDAHAYHQQMHRLFGLE